MKNKYTKELLEPIIISSRFWGEVFEKLGIIQGGGNYNNIKKHVNNYKISTSHFVTKSEALSLKSIQMGRKLKYEDLFVKNCKHGRDIVKRFIYKNKLKEIKCELCGQDENWRGKKFSLILDHINGVNNDNRIENLRLLCPNCNSTLDTHCRGKKFKHERKNIKLL
jgi:hypothetical protein